MNQRLKIMYTVMQCYTGTLDRNYLALYPGPTPSLLKYISIACSCICISGAAGAKQPFYSALWILAI